MYLVSFAGMLSQGRIRARAVGMLGNRAVIQKVLDRLEEWVDRYPVKLKKAAKSCPMEGRTHCRGAGWT